LQIQSLNRPARYTIYAGFALAAAGESTFWFTVIRAKYFATEEEKERADAFIERCKEAVRGYRRVWLRNYWAYWAGGIWGL
jgi:hypothetical protein